jgi:hypothetical protein
MVPAPNVRSLVARRQPHGKMRPAALSLCLLCSVACSPSRPSCSGPSGPVYTITGEVAPGQVVSHAVAYDTRGSQNNVEFTWSRRGQPGAPALRVFATRTTCVDFRPPALNTGTCPILGSAGEFVPGQIAGFLYIVSGQGNPDIFADGPAEYILWVVGDPVQAASYTLTAVWNRANDC